MSANFLGSSWQKQIVITTNNNHINKNGASILYQLEMKRIKQNFDTLGELDEHLIKPLIMNLIITMSRQQQNFGTHSLLLWSVRSEPKNRAQKSANCSYGGQSTHDWAHSMFALAPVRIERTLAHILKR